MSFSEQNRTRCESPQGFNHPIKSWTASDWMTAVVGEIGEAANIIKKLNRVRDGIPGNTESPEELRAMLADEIADAAIYLDLLAQSFDFDMNTIVAAKFAKTSQKIGYCETKLPVSTSNEPTVWKAVDRLDEIDRMDALGGSQQG
ncbi:MAG: hypothetical protein AB7U73_08205 [Pirellulales bacterium]